MISAVTCVGALSQSAPLGCSACKHGISGRRTKPHEFVFIYFSVKTCDTPVVPNPPGHGPRVSIKSFNLSVFSKLFPTALFIATFRFCATLGVMETQLHASNTHLWLGKQVTCRHTTNRHQQQYEHMPVGKCGASSDHISQRNCGSLLLMAI